MRRFLEHFAPEKLIIIEGGELHPLFLLATLRQELPAAIINGWFSRNQIQRSEIFLPLLGAIRLFGVRHEEDREKLIELGIPAERINVTGDLKFDAVALVPSSGLEDQLRALAGDRPILIAGSTHPGEEPAVLDAFEKIGGGRRALLILATRNPRYFQLAENVLRQRKLAYLKRSQLPADGQRPAVIFLDRIGELASLYQLATAAFVGGSLVPNGGGQSPLEAANCAVPVAVGPNMNNFRLVAEIFDQANAWRRITSSDELADAWSSWLDNPQLAHDLGQRAAKLIESHRGALARTLEVLQDFLLR
jgi:3-deoxy-D-manno-octulosonic-acid transferase